jgi:hypothetical protein
LVAASENNPFDGVGQQQIRDILSLNRLPVEAAIRAASL